MYKNLLKQELTDDEFHEITDTLIAIALTVGLAMALGIINKKKEEI